MISWNGSFFVVRGVIMLWNNSQMPEMKMFIVEKGFEFVDGVEQFDIYLPFYILGAQMVVFLFSVAYKNYLQSQVFKTESHPYYQIN